MNGALAAFAFLPGLAVGSFLNVVAVRVPERLSIVRPGSSCTSCHAPIVWYDNIPVVSWLLLRGRCRNCHAAIPVKYPVVELGTALLVSACVWRWGATTDALVCALFCAVLITISVTDLERRVIPNLVVLPAAAVVLAARTVTHPSPEWAIAAAAGFLFLLVAALAYPGGLGMGDVKLALLIGAALGSSLPVGLMAGFVAALVPSAVLLARHGQAARKMAIPLGPFLAAGALLALFAGAPIVHAYLHLV